MHALCLDVRAEEKEAIYHDGKTGGNNFHVLIFKHSDVSALSTFFCLQLINQFMYTSVLPAYMCAYHAHAWGLQRLEENIESPGTGVTENGYELPCGR